MITGLPGVVVQRDVLGVSGITTANMAARITADLALRGTDWNRAWLLVNLGANDVAALPAEATWKADMGAILDGYHAKWPNGKAYVMRPWVRGEAADCNTLAAWIADVVAARSTWAFVGPDERVFLEGGDDGATYTSDGVHPNAAGAALTAAQWKAAMGY